MAEDGQLEALLSADPAQLSYEQARDGLLQIVHRLEEGEATLEQSLRLWEHGEALARRCGEWLDNAQARIEAVTGGDERPNREQPTPEPPTLEPPTPEPAGEPQMPF